MNFPEFAVPQLDGDLAERVIASAGVPYSRTGLKDLDVSVFTFKDDHDFYKAGSAVSIVFDDEITGAIHKAIQGNLSPDEAVWADWESHDFMNSGGPKSRKESMKTDANAVLDAYSQAKAIRDPECRARAMAYVTMMSKNLV